MSNWQVHHSNHELPPRGAIGLRHMLFLAVILAIPIASREYETSNNRAVFVLLAIALSVVYATAVNYRRSVSMARVVLAISVGMAIYATAITLLVDLLVRPTEFGLIGHFGIVSAGVLGCLAMCGIMIIVFALG